MAFYQVIIENYYYNYTVGCYFICGAGDPLYMVCRINAGFTDIFRDPFYFRYDWF